jgi:hypothetical protein
MRATEFEKKVRTGILNDGVFEIGSKIGFSTTKRVFTFLVLFKVCIQIQEGV